MPNQYDPGQNKKWWGYQPQGNTKKTVAPKPQPTKPPVAPPADPYGDKIPADAPNLMPGDVWGDYSTKTPQDTLNAITKLFWEQSDPARRNILQRGVNFLWGDFDPSQSPAYAPGKNALEGQYGAARENILASMPSGGALYSALGDLEGARADSLTNLDSAMAQDEYNKIYQLATGMPATALTGASSAAGIDAQLQNIAAQTGISQDQMTMGAKSAIGQGLGSVFGSMGGK